MKRLVFATLIALVASGNADAQKPVERFDVSGMPAHPGTFLEQQIAELIKTYQPGDLTTAGQIQYKLAAFYRQIGDSARAREALERVGDGDGLAAPSTAHSNVSVVPSRPAPKNHRVVAPPSKSPPAKVASGFSGRYYVMRDGSTMHTWEFADDGTYLFTWIASASGTSVRTSERGTYVLGGSSIDLRPESQAGGYVTPGVGGRSTTMGGSAERTSGVRRFSFRLLGPGGRDGIVLDSVRMKPKSW